MEKLTGDCSHALAMSEDEAETFSSAVEALQKLLEDNVEVAREALDVALCSYDESDKEAKKFTKLPGGSFTRQWLEDLLTMDPTPQEDIHDDDEDKVDVLSYLQSSDVPSQEETGSSPFMTEEIRSECANTDGLFNYNVFEKERQEIEVRSNFIAATKETEVSREEMRDQVTAFQSEVVSRLTDLLILVSNEENGGGGHGGMKTFEQFQYLLKWLAKHENCPLLDSVMHVFKAGEQQATEAANGPDAKKLRKPRGESGEANSSEALARKKSINELLDHFLVMVQLVSYLTTHRGINEPLMLSKAEKLRFNEFIKQCEWELQSIASRMHEVRAAQTVHHPGLKLGKIISV